MGRPLDPSVDAAIEAATLKLLAEQGFANMSIEAVAAEAGVGKPAIYRRYDGKPALVASVIKQQLPSLDMPDLGDTRAELWRAVEGGFPEDGAAYVGLIAGLISEQYRHPELIEAFRRIVVLPRRAAIQTLIERGQGRGDIRADVDPEAGVDMFSGPFLARVFAGVDTSKQWRATAFEAWWNLVAVESLADDGGRTSEHRYTSSGTESSRRSA